MSAVDTESARQREDIDGYAAASPTALTPAAQIDVLRAVLHQPAASYVHSLGTIALNRGYTIAIVQDVVDRHGWPDRTAIADAIRSLEQEALLQEHAPASADDTGELVRLPIASVHPDPDNPRDNLTDIPDLAASISEVGLLQPIVVRRHPDDGHLVVVAGHRRLAALQLLAWATIPVIVRDHMRPDDVLAAMLIENGQRADLDPIETARGLRKLKTQSGCTDTELARKVGRSAGWVGGRLALLALTPDQQDDVRRKKMSLAEAEHHGRIHSGRVGKTGVDRGWHLGPQHELATKAKARCQRLGHSRARMVGGMGCGECWESVIRADERQHLHDQSEQRGRCVLCDTEATA